MDRTSHGWSLKFQYENWLCWMRTNLLVYSVSGLPITFLIDWNSLVSVFPLSIPIIFMWPQNDQHWRHCIIPNHEIKRSQMHPILSSSLFRSLFPSLLSLSLLFISVDDAHLTSGALCGHAIYCWGMCVVGTCAWMPREWLCSVLCESPKISRTILVWLQLQLSVLAQCSSVYHFGQSRPRTAVLAFPLRLSYFRAPHSEDSSRF